MCVSPDPTPPTIESLTCWESAILSNYAPAKSWQKWADTFLTNLSVEELPGWVFELSVAPDAAKALAIIQATIEAEAAAPTDDSSITTFQARLGYAYLLFEQTDDFQQLVQDMWRVIAAYRQPFANKFIGKYMNFEYEYYSRFEDSGLEKQLIGFSKTAQQQWDSLQAVLY